MWGAGKVTVYSLSPEKSVAREAGSFTTTSSIILLYEYSVFLIEKDQVEVRTLQVRYHVATACSNYSLLFLTCALKLILCY